MKKITKFISVIGATALLTASMAPFAACAHKHTPGTAVKEKEVAATCTEEGSYEEVVYCTDCKEEISREKKTTAKLPHTYSAEWQKDADQHWHVCSVCGAEGEKDAHVPGPAATETENQVCTVCGYVIAPALNHEHSLTFVAAKEATCKDTGNIAYYVCSGDTGCGKYFSDDKAEHEIEDKTSVVTPKTENHTWDNGTAQGDVIKYTCTVCGATKTENKPVDDRPLAEKTYELGQSYIKSHAEGTAVTYVMEAENTPLGQKLGVGYSGQLSEKDLVINPSSMYNTDCSNGQMVNYLYRKGVSLQFFIISDREVDDAVLQMRLSAEYMDMIIGPQKSVGASNDYIIRVDQPTVEDLALPENDGAWNYWDDMFLKFYDANPDLRDPEAAAPYYVTDWECTFEKNGVTYNGIRMDASQYGQALMPCQNFTVTSHLKLYKGITCISFITNSSAKPVNENTGAPLGTMDAYAPVFDCIGITTSAQIGMYKPEANNNSTKNACWIDYDGTVFNSGN